MPSIFKFLLLFFFSEAMSENGNLEDLFKQFASLMPLRGYKLLQVTFLKTLLDASSRSLYVTIVFLKALANEGTLLRTHCCRHKCFPVCPRAQHLLWTQI